MSQFRTVIGKGLEACFRTAKVFDDEMVEIDHTLKGRGIFDQLSRRKCSSVYTPTCAFLLKFDQNCSRFNTPMAEARST